MAEFHIENGRFRVESGDKPVFALCNVTILDYSHDRLRVKSKTLEKLIPTLTRLAKQFDVSNPWVLDEHGLSLVIRFSNREMPLQDIIDKRFHYNIDMCLHSKSDGEFVFKIKKIANKKHNDVDLPEPDHFDIAEIRQNISRKVSAFQNKFGEINHTKIDNMPLSELVELEENISEFIAKH